MSQVFNFTNSSSLRAACEQGSTFSFVLYVTQECTGLPTDLTDCVVKMQVRLTAASSTVILTIGTVAGNVTIDAEAGTITASVAPNVTAALAPGMYVYDLDLTESGGSIRRLIEGKFEITAEVTR